MKKRTYRRRRRLKMSSRTFVYDADGTMHVNTTMYGFDPNGYPISLAKLKREDRRRRFTSNPEGETQ